MSQAPEVTDPAKIRAGAEEQGGRHARVAATSREVEGASRNAFFKVFGEGRLAPLEPQGTASGKTSRFSNLVNR